MDSPALMSYASAPARMGELSLDELLSAATDMPVDNESTGTYSLSNPAPFNGGGAGQAAHKLVKIPEWKQKLFRNGDDIDSHLYEFKNQVERLPGLTEEQVAHYLLDSLSPEIRAVAQALHKSTGMPNAPSMMVLLKKAYPKSRTLIYENFEDQIGCLKQGNAQKLAKYIADVQGILNKFKQSETQFDMKRYGKLEEMAFHALSLRLNPTDQKRLDEQKRLWLEKGNLNPMLLRNRYETLLIRLVQMSQEDGSKSSHRDRDNEEKEEKLKPICKFGRKCNRDDCVFRHKSPKSEIKKKITCNYCKKSGHVEAECLTKKFKERKEKKD